MCPAVLTCQTRLLTFALLQYWCFVGDGDFYFGNILFVPPTPPLSHPPTPPSGQTELNAASHTEKKNEVELFLLFFAGCDVLVPD